MSWPKHPKSLKEDFIGVLVLLAGSARLLTGLSTLNKPTMTGFGRDLVVPARGLAVYERSD